MSIFRRAHRALLKWLAKSYGTGTSRRKRRLLRALGHDPEKHQALSILTGRWPGIRVVDQAGNNVAFYTLDQLRRKKRDPEFLQAWKDAG